MYAEDTRRANKLLNHLGIKKSVRSYFLGNENKKINEILELVKDGNSIALISDAGTPLVSDPGQELIKVLIENNIQIISGDPSNAPHPNLGPVHPGASSHPVIYPPVQSGASEPSSNPSSNANIDLGAVYQQTVENRVTK